MNTLIFLIILALLVLVHELGHFLIAKKSGVRVDEFGLGFPPRLFGKKIGETIYSLNLLPFGGFVKIFGENAESLTNEDGTVEDSSRSLVHKNRFIQAAVLSGGVLFNMIFAWLVISVGLMVGLPSAIDSSQIGQVKNPQVVISSVVPSSPAEKAGLKAGDIIVSLNNEVETLAQNINPETVSGFIQESATPITVSYSRGAKVSEAFVTPEKGIVADKQAIGIGMDMIGIMKLPVGTAILEGGTRTIQLFKTVAVNIFYFLRDAVMGRGDFSQVAGPVGMVALVGDARDLGFAYLVFFTALLSINLAVINLIPFPALDGGRLLIVLIETIKRSSINSKVVYGINAFGFGLLLLLMLIVTYHDVVKLF